MEYQNFELAEKALEKAEQIRDQCLVLGDHPCWLTFASNLTIVRSLLNKHEKAE